MQHSLIPLLFLLLAVVPYLCLPGLPASMSSPSVEQLQQQITAMMQQQKQQQEAFTQAMSQASAENANLRAQVQAQAAAASTSASASPAPGQAMPMVAHAARIDMKPLQPSAFTGAVSQNADQWLVEMERYFLVSQLSESDARRVPLATTYLKDTASVWFTTIATDLDANASWPQFKEKFIERFRPIAASRVARAALRSLKCRHKVAGYTQEFQKHMQMITDMSVTDQIEAYLAGLPHHIAAEVDRERPTSLAKAMEIAQRIELWLATRRPANSYGPQYRGFNDYRAADSSRAAGGAGGDAMDLTAIYGDEGEAVYDGAEDESHHVHFVQSTRGRGGRGGGGRSFRGRGGSGMKGSKSGPQRSPEELEKLYKENRCFSCGEQGHQSRFCSKQQSKN